MFKLYLTLFVVLCEAVTGDAVPRNETAETWNLRGEKEIKRAENFELIKHRAKNVVLFLGDGMGVSTVTAARILNAGEMSLLYFENFPNTALSKTYCADSTVTDSAASSTAYQCGVKINKGMLGLDQRVLRYDCNASMTPEMQLTSILDWSLEEGKSVGIVTTTRVTHATPAGAYANVADRDWEGDSELSQNALQDGCRDIARQLVEDYLDIQVVMGGGREFFLPESGIDPNNGTEGSNSKKGRRDQRNLTKEWEDGQHAKQRKAKYIWNASQLQETDLVNTDYLLGLFSQSHMAYDQDRDPKEQPSLAEMTEAAITILSRNPKGFYLLVEGGRIDHSHHENQAYNALHDTIAFAKAVEAASAVTSEKETLTVVTADHSHTMVIAGYQSRGNSIFDLADKRLDINNNTFTTLLYGDGPGYRYQVNRTNITVGESNKEKYRQESAVPMESASHGGEDVAIFSKGPMAHLFHSVHEENYIAHVMAYASCVGRYKNKCPPMPTSGSDGIYVAHWLLITSVAINLLVKYE